MAESSYFISEHDELVPILVMLLQGALSGTRITIQSGENIIITITKEANIGYTVTTAHDGVRDLLDRLSDMMKKMKP